GRSFFREAHLEPFCCTVEGQGLACGEKADVVELAGPVRAVFGEAADGDGGVLWPVEAGGKEDIVFGGETPVLRGEGGAFSFVESRAGQCSGVVQRGSFAEYFPGAGAVDAFAV